jgi:hypothetical protein
MTQTELTGVLSLLEKDRELQDLLGDAQVKRPLYTRMSVCLH